MQLKVKLHGEIEFLMKKLTLLYSLYLFTKRSSVCASQEEQKKLDYQM